MDRIKEWVEDKIKNYENVSFETSHLSPGTAYELGRYDILIEIMDLMERHGIND